MSVGISLHGLKMNVYEGPGTEVGEGLFNP